MISEDSEVGTQALIDKGKADGTKDLPSQNWKGLNVIEAKVVKAYQRLIDAETKGYDRDQRKLISKLKLINPRLFPSDTISDDETDDDRSILVDQAKSDMSTEISRKKNSIQNKLRLVYDAKKEYEAFKDQNNLSHDLSLPSERWKKTKPWIWLILILLIEGVFNGIVFAANAGGQRFDFIVQAVLIAIVNVGVFGLLIRASWKYLCHIKTFLKVWAVTGLLIFSTAAFMFNLGAAHYRDAISSEQSESEERSRDEEGQEALDLLRNKKIILAEFESYAFFILGLGFILFSVLKWRDIFPGYPEQAKKQRQFLSAQSDLEEECKLLIKELDKIYSNAKKELKSSSTLLTHQTILNLMNNLDNSGDKKFTKEGSDAIDEKFTPTIIDDHKLALELLSKIQDKYKDMRANLNYGDQQCGKAIEFYRKANRSAREDISHVPAHWDQKWKPEWYIPEDPGDFGLCSSEYAQSLHDKQIKFIEDHLDPSYRQALEKVESLSKYHETLDPSGTDSVTND